MNCPKCGKDVGEAKACLECGEIIAAEEIPKSWLL